MRRASFISAALLAALLLLPAAGLCATPPPPVVPRATHAFTAVDDGTPRTLTSGGITTVHLQLRNDGTTTWTSESGFHVAYHWLDRRGREIVRDGVRTDLPGSVPPGGTVTIEALVRVPEIPGLYQLRWDMVQEGVAWFSGRDPQPSPTHEILVLPGAGLLGATLPPIFALIVWVMIRRRQGGPSPPAASAFYGIADVIWAAASLFGLQLFFLDQADIGGASTAIWISAVAAIVPCVLLLFVLPRRWRVWSEWLLVLVTAVVLVADILYVRFFGDMISLAALGASGQTGDVWSSAASLLKGLDVCWFLTLPCGALLVRSVGRLPAPDRRVRWTARGVVTAAAVLVVAGAGSSAGATDLVHDNSLTQVFRNVWLVGDIGPLGFHAFDAWRESRDTILRPTLTDAQRDEVRAWFAARAGERAGVGPDFGIARGMNILVIQVESMQRFLVGLQVNGQAIMPNLDRWRREALWFSNVTDQTNQGRTSDAEFTTMVSLLPLASGAMSFRHPSNHYAAFPSVLADHGYSTLSAIPFDGSFWNRLITHPQYGITTNLFDEDFKPGEEVGWGLNDRDFFRQMAPRLPELHQPFFAWLITLSLHHPFDSFPRDLETLQLGSWEGTTSGNYLQAMHLFDTSLGELEETMRKQGLLDRTVIVVYGDHDAGLPADPAFARLAGIPDDPGMSPADSVPLFVRVPGAAAPRGERALPAGLTDVAPTVLALLGIDPAGLPYVGRNLLGHPGDDPLVRPYGSWVDSRHFYTPGGPAPADDKCEDLRSGGDVPISACLAESRAAAHEAEVSRLVTAYDLQRGLVESSASRR